MYHKINHFKCRPLEKLNQIAHLTLEFGLTQERHDVEPYRQLKEDFVIHFSNAGFPNAGTWLWRKYEIIRDPLLELLAIPVKEKKAILKAYDYDTEIIVNFTSPKCFAKPKFGIQRLKPIFAPALACINGILGHFYTSILVSDYHYNGRVGKGIPKEVIGEISDLTRQTVLQAYIDAQDHIHVCPGCDDHFPEIDDNERVYEDVDHYFPKALYPFLAIHMLNLTPLCMYCNQRFKQAKDPLLLENGTLIPLVEACHPYTHPMQNEVAFRFERQPDALHIKLEAVEACHSTRVLSIKHLLNIESRWNGAFQQEWNDENASHEYPKINPITNPFANELRRSFRYFRDVQPTKEWLQQIILEIFVPDIKESIGQTPYGISAYQYASWVATDNSELDKWVSYAPELKVKAEVQPS